MNHGRGHDSCKIWDKRILNRCKFIVFRVVIYLELVMLSVLIHF
ncbi:hypothetical protein Leryth_012149 [Lithospermum erythrorhizon]|nr:hypothetical protein Leryth_012149 [Lithospermum erythrorhizon]